MTPKIKKDHHQGQAHVHYKIDSVDDISTPNGGTLRPTGASVRLRLDPDGRWRFDQAAIVGPEVVDGTENPDVELECTYSAHQQNVPVWLLPTIAAAVSEIRSME
jgi:hypothetical protein